MKKVKLLNWAFTGILFCSSLAVFACNTGNGAGNKSVTTGETTKNEFKMKSDGTWAGMSENKKYWYKLDSMAGLWWSADGKTWASVKEGMWQDKQGHWLKIGEKKLWWTADMGKTWSEVPEWQWEGPDGEWYKFDATWKLWVKNS